MKRKLILLSLLSIAVITVLSVWVSIPCKEKELPPVMFSLLYKRSNYYSVWTIDNAGNIYCFHDCDGSYLDMTDYENKRKDENCKYIKTIDEILVKEKYVEFQTILLDDHYHKNLIHLDVDLYTGIKNWYGYDYNEEHILMHGFGHTLYLSEDSRMKELADWMEDQIREDLQEYDKYCSELEAEEYYQEYLKEKQSLEGTGN